MALDSIVKSGFTQTETMGRVPHVAEALAGQQLAEFKNRLKALGLRVNTVHAPPARNVLGPPDEDWRREKVTVFANFLRFAGTIGATGVVIHPVPNPCFVPHHPHDPRHPGRMRDAVRRSLDELLPVTWETGVYMLLENLPYQCDYPFLHMQELRSLVDDYPEKQVGLVVDTGHAWISGHDPAKEILAAGSRLKGTHLQDVEHDVQSDCEVDDKHWVPTHGGLDWNAIRSALAEVDYKGSWTFEVTTPRHGESPEQLASFTREVARAWGL